MPVSEPVPSFPKSCSDACAAPEGSLDDEFTLSTEQRNSVKKMLSRNRKQMSDDIQGLTQRTSSVIDVILFECACSSASESSTTLSESCPTRVGREENIMRNYRSDWSNVAIRWSSGVLKTTT